MVTVDKPYEILYSTGSEMSIVRNMLCNTLLSNSVFSVIMMEGLVGCNSFKCSHHPITWTFICIIVAFRSCHSLTHVCLQRPTLSWS